MAIACAWMVVGHAARLEAATRYVDGRCPASGTGAQLACGAAGPFRTIQEGVDAMTPGDTVLVRGGVYEERVSIARRCTAAAPCIVAGYANEQPLVRGMRRRGDWSAAGSGVWWRAMEATPDVPTNQQPDDHHPMNLYQETGAGPLTPLGYDGDGVATPREGHYSYHPASRRLYVNPLGTAHPADAVHVPHVSVLIELDSPAAYVTLRGFRLEGVRGTLVEAVNTGYPLDGIVVAENQIRYFPRFGIRFNGAPGLVVRDNVIEYGGRGLGGYLGGSYGAYGMRLFAAHGALIQGNVVAHLGHGGCSWCDAPWNDNDHNRLGTNVYANAIDFKQSEGGTIADNTILDVADRGIGLDVSRDVTVARNRVTRANAALGSRTQTPVAGFTRCADNVFADNVVVQSQIGVRVEDDGLAPGAAFLARIERTAISGTPTRYQVPDEPYVIVVEGTSPPTTSTTTSTSSSTQTTLPGATTSTSSTILGSTLPTTTSSSTSTSTLFPRATTSTTMPAFERYVGGTKLSLRSHAERPEKRRLAIRSVDATRLLLGDGGDPAALLVTGGSLVVSAIGGEWFEAHYPLAAAGWTPLNGRNPRAGLRYRDPAGPITSVVFRANGQLRVSGRGAALVQPLGAEPALVAVELRLGPYRYCLEFGGTQQRFVQQRALVRKNALRPPSCMLDS